MKLRIQYQANYLYEEPVSLSPHYLRVFPKQDLYSQTIALDFTPPEQADCQYRRDLFDNDIACLFFPELRDRVAIGLEALVETPKRDPFHFLLESHALEMPMKYSDMERKMLVGYCQRSEHTPLPSELIQSRSRPTVETLVHFNQWIHQNIAYERREEGEALPPAETLRKGSASCRDFSVLMLDILRANGLAGRMASGFLWEGDVEEGKHVAEGALHAWVETYLPGAGWVGLDPTNGVFCDHHCITTAVGLVPAQIAPVAGSYYGKKVIPSTLETRLKVEAVEK